MRYPRLLVLSNNSFSKSNSNGRTLGSLLQGWPKDRIAQFAIMCIDTDFDVCDNYYQVRDSEAVKSLLKGEQCVTGTDVNLSAANVQQQSKYGKSGKTALKMLLRNAVWNTGRWKGEKFKQWVNDFAPEAVMLQSGDSAFMLRLARKLAEKRHIPLLMFNTEGYLFFDHNFLKHHWSDALCFPILKRKYRREFKNTLSNTSFAIYGNDKLRNDYQNYLGHNSDTIFTASSLEFKAKGAISSTPQISYLGNLGLRRPEALAEVGQVLQSISPNLSIDVYGNAKPESIKLLNEAPGVEYKGFVSYARVKEIIYESDILFHVEKNDPVLCKELRYAFSTKIADSICSGTPFVLYAPSHLACSQYVRETGAGWQVSTQAEMKAILMDILNGHGIAEVSARAHETAVNNHSGIKNAERFRQDIVSACE